MQKIICNILDLRFLRSISFGIPKKVFVFFIFGFLVVDTCGVEKVLFVGGAEWLIFVKDCAVVDLFEIGNLVIVATGRIFVGNVELLSFVNGCGVVVFVDIGNLVNVVIDIRCLYTDELIGKDMFSLKKKKNN